MRPLRVEMAFLSVSVKRPQGRARVKTAWPVKGDVGDVWCQAFIPAKDCSVRGSRDTR